MENWFQKGKVNNLLENQECWEDMRKYFKLSWSPLISWSYHGETMTSYYDQHKTETPAWVTVLHTQKATLARYSATHTIIVKMFARFHLLSWYCYIWCHLFCEFFSWHKVKHSSASQALWQPSGCLIDNYTSRPIFLSLPILLLQGEM